MVPEAVTDDGALTGRVLPVLAGSDPAGSDPTGSHPTGSDPAGGDRPGPSPAGKPSPADEQPRITFDRVGPGGTVASDSSFGVALVGLWQQCAESGAPVGFPAPVARIEVAARAAELVDGLRKGTVVGVVANHAHRLVGVGLLRTGRGIRDHTGRVEILLVHPDRVRDGLGTTILRDLLELATARGVERVDLEMQDDTGLAGFFGGFGFTEWGRRPSWLRLGPGGPRDEVVLGAVLAPAGT